jgi:hypothetical protein
VLHVLLLRHQRVLGAGLHLSQLSHFRGPAHNLSEIVEDPEHFDTDIFYKVLNLMTTLTNSETAHFDAEKWAATYNAADLKPDVLTKTLNKAFDYDQGSHQWKRSGSLDTGAKVGVLDALSVEGKFSGTFSSEDLQTWLKQHSIEASFEGEKIVVKSIDLQRVDMPAFSQDSQFSSSMTLVSSGVFQENGSMDFGRLLASDATAMPLPGLVADLSRRVGDLGGSVTALSGSVTDALPKIQNLTDKLTTAGTEIERLKKTGNGAPVQPNIPLMGNPAAARNTEAKCPSGSVMIGMDLRSSAGIPFVTGQPPYSTRVIDSRVIESYSVICDPKYNPN